MVYRGEKNNFSACRSRVWPTWVLLWANRKR